MTQEVQLQQRVAAPIDRVFREISDHCGMHRWLVPGAKIRLDPEGKPDRNGVGAVRIIERAGFSAHERIVSFEPPHRFSYTVLSGIPIRNHLGTVSLSEVDGATNIDWTIRFDPKVPASGRILALFVRIIIGRGLKRFAELLA
jgi:uncharacterized protein YndB with AHSA1/START domain